MLSLVPPQGIHYGLCLSVVFVLCAMLFSTQYILYLDHLKCQIFLWWHHLPQQSSLGSSKYKRQEGKNVVHRVDNVTKEIRWEETCYMEDLKNAQLWGRRLRSLLSLPSAAKEEVSLSGFKFGSNWSGAGPSDAVIRCCLQSLHKLNSVYTKKKI